MAKYSQGKFVPKNPKKLAGNPSPTYRSGWEAKFMSFLDTNPSVIEWASELIRIPYVNPLTGKSTTYVPDFLVVYKDKNGKICREVVEVKPIKETMMENAKSMRDKAYLIVNSAKWKAAMIFCHKNGFVFRVITEKDLFGSGAKK
jgi:hypothetical protein